MAALVNIVVQNTKISSDETPMTFNYVIEMCV